MYRVNNIYWCTTEQTGCCKVDVLLRPPDFVSVHRSSIVFHLLLVFSCAWFSIVLGFVKSTKVARFLRGKWVRTRTSPMGGLTKIQQYVALVYISFKIEGYMVQPYMLDFDMLVYFEVARFFCSYDTSTVVVIKLSASVHWVAHICFFCGFLFKTIGSKTMKYRIEENKAKGYVYSRLCGVFVVLL